MKRFTYNNVTPEVIDKVLNLVAIIHLLTTPIESKKA